MKLIGNEILRALQQEFPELHVRDAYLGEEPEFPMLTIEEIPSNTGVYLDNQPTVVMNIFQIEVYAKQSVVGGELRNKKDAAMHYALLADDFLNRKYGFTMRESVTGAPYSDPSVYRVPLRYAAYMDTRTGDIYREI